MLTWWTLKSYNWSNHFNPCPTISCNNGLRNWLRTGLRWMHCV